MLLTSRPSSWSQSQERRNNALLGPSVLTWQAAQGSGGTWHWTTLLSPRCSRSSGGRAWSEGMFKVMLFRLPKMDSNSQASSYLLDPAQQKLWLNCCNVHSLELQESGIFLSCCLSYVCPCLFTPLHRKALPQRHLPSRDSPWAQSRPLPFPSARASEKSRGIELNCRKKKDKNASTGIIQPKLCAQ